MLTSHEITDGLKTRFIGKKLFVFETIDSTNACARLLAETGVENGTIVYAAHQTRGKGRMNRRWLSEKDVNLLFSVVFHPEFAEQKYFLVPLMISLSVVETVRILEPTIALQVKWPNDVLDSDGRKIAGILTELTRTYDDKPRIVAGTGINVNQIDFPENLGSKASSLSVVCGKEFDLRLLFHTLLERIEERYEQIIVAPELLVEAWRSHCTLFNKKVAVEQDQRTVLGIFRDIDSGGAMILEDKKGGKIRILAGDVTTVHY